MGEEKHQGIHWKSLKETDYLQYLYRCTVHSVVHLINTPTNAHI